MLAKKDSILGAASLYGDFRHLPAQNWYELAADRKKWHAMIK